MPSWSREQFGSVVRLTLARPPINALDQNALEELADVLRELEAERTSSCLIVTGGLEGIFCSGGDLKYWRGIRDGRAVSSAGAEVFLRLARLDIPTIAGINGQVIGDGIGLALACDLRVASHRASFRLPEAAYGFIPGWGSIGMLVAAVGRAHASELLLAGRSLDAGRARSMGLVTDVVPSERLSETLLEWGRSIEAFSPNALRAAKRALRGGDELAHFERVWGGVDWEKGIAALLAKRAPVFAEQGGHADGLDRGVQAHRTEDRGNHCC